MLNCNLEALPSQIRAKSLASAAPAAQNDPHKKGTADISFGGYWQRPRGERNVLNVEHNRTPLPSTSQNTLSRMECEGRLVIVLQ